MGRPQRGAPLCVTAATQMEVTALDEARPSIADAHVARGTMIMDSRPRGQINESTRDMWRGANSTVSTVLAKTTRYKKRKPYDMPDLSVLPSGRRRAVEALIGGNEDRTYPEAARIAGMAEGTLLTHVNRVRQNHPRLYTAIRAVRLAQLAVRHERALANAKAHSRAYFKRRANRRFCELFGYYPWQTRL